jgi:hypothetical protein
MGEEPRTVFHRQHDSMLGPHDIMNYLQGLVYENPNLEAWQLVKDRREVLENDTHRIEIITKGVSPRKIVKKAGAEALETPGQMPLDDHARYLIEDGDTGGLYLTMSRGGGSGHLIAIDMLRGILRPEGAVNDWEYFEKASAGYVNFATETSHLVVLRSKGDLDPFLSGLYGVFLDAKRRQDERYARTPKAAKIH